MTFRGRTVTIGIGMTILGMVTVLGWSHQYLWNSDCCMSVLTGTGDRPKDDDHPIDMMSISSIVCACYRPMCMSVCMDLHQKKIGGDLFSY